MHAGNDDAISYLWVIVFDVLDRTGPTSVSRIKQWLAAYSYYEDIKANLDPSLIDAVIKHALQSND